MRPTSVAVIGTFVILSGIAGVFALASNWSVLALDAAHPESAPIALRKLVDDPARLTWTKAQVIFGGVASLVALAAGFRLFALRPWSRRVVLCWAAYVTVTNVYLILRGDFAAGAGVELPFAAVGVLVGGMCIPIATLFVLTRRSVAAAFGLASSRVSLQAA